MRLGVSCVGWGSDVTVRLLFEHPSIYILLFYFPLHTGTIFVVFVLPDNLIIQ